MHERERIVKARMSLDVDERSHGYDEWVDVPEMDDPYVFVEECITDYMHHHSEEIAEIADKPFHEIADPRAYVDVTYEFKANE